MRIDSTTVTVPGPVRTVKLQSASRAAVTHTVVFACTCEGFRYAGHCYHLAEAAIKLRWMARASRRHSDEL